MEKVTTNEIHTLIEAFKADNRTRTLTVGICRVIVTKKASSGKVCIMIRGENDHLLSTYEIDEYSLEKLTEEVNSTIEQEYDELQALVADSFMSGVDHPSSWVRA